MYVPYTYVSVLVLLFQRNPGYNLIIYVLMLMYVFIYKKLFNFIIFIKFIFFDSGIRFFKLTHALLSLLIGSYILIPLFACAH